MCRASWLRKVAVGRNMNRSAISAAIIAKALSQPNRRSEGRLGKHRHRQTAGKHRRGQDQRRSDQDGGALDAHGGILVDILDLPAVEKINRRAQSETE